MTESKISRPTAKDGRPRGARGLKTCKTCTSCRQRKVKCDGTRPHCNDCQLNGVTCVYPRDARRELRPSRSRIQSLEDTISVMLEHMKASGLEFPVQASIGGGEGQQYSESQAGPSPAHSTAAATSGSVSSASLFSVPHQEHRNPIQLTPVSNPPDPSVCQTPFDFDGTRHRIQPPDEEDEEEELNEQNTMMQSPPGRAVGRVPVTAPAESREQEDTKNSSASLSNCLSPCEARVAGVFHENGCVSSVHGLAGIMNPTDRERHTENISKLMRRGEGAIAESKARLISNAALQKQRETQIFRQPSDHMDLDGCNPELAKHLLDLHFNRQHFAYLVTYRPAMMDSLANGGGVWANKLLLNAIYYSSSMYSDRECLRSDGPNDVQSPGSRFYTRFRQLLVDEIQRPSIASAMALLLTSATLVSQGHSSAGWGLSGTAYRMILDLGCHMMLAPDYQSVTGLSNGRRLRRDLELEMRKRLYWGAYATDATQALYLGRPCMFASVEARVPLQPLDTFEELEDWQPYEDPCFPNPNQPAYAPQPAYGVSTFMALARLLQISTKITDLYGIQSIKLSNEVLIDRKRSIEWELENWKATLPSHLQFNPDNRATPPPHQVTPHTTFYALTILLHRAFLEQGHLRRCSDSHSKRLGQDVCISSALMIEKYVRSYRMAFTLRRAPFLLSYAVYSGATAILSREHHDRGKYTETISFFWTCLNELQRGCNYGLKKPLGILHDIVNELQFHVNEEGIDEPVMHHLQPSLDESLFFRLPNYGNDMGEPAQVREGGGQNVVTPEYWNTLEYLDTTYGPIDAHMPDFLNGQENDIYQDSLYGLFAPPHPMP